MIRRNHIISVLLIKLLTAISRAVTGAVFRVYLITGIPSFPRRVPAGTFSLECFHRETVNKHV